MGIIGYVLGIDIGTTNIKALLLDCESGSQKGLIQKSYEIEISQSGYAQYPPQLWYQHSCVCIKRLLKEYDIRKDEILGLTISGQMHGLVALDKDGNPLGSAILHCDTRGQCVISDLQEKIGKEIVEKQLLNPPYLGFLAITL